MSKAPDPPVKDKEKIAEEANKACNLPGNKNGPDLDKGGGRTSRATSDLA